MIPIGIVDYNMGNIGSVVNMLSRLGVESCIVSTAKEIDHVDKLILPGVGNFAKAMYQLNQTNLVDGIKRNVCRDDFHLMGICLGMQLLAESSTEGDTQGLGLIKGKVVGFENNIDPTLKIPHMGWNYIKPSKTSNLLIGLEEKLRFYFVHSYFVDCADAADTLTTTQYGHDFVSAFEHNNLIGVQFHPEKSHRFGIALFKNFLSSY